MNPRLAACAALLLFVPAAIAVEGTITPTVATPVLGSSHIYWMDLDAGDEVAIDLSWTDPLADLDLIVIPPRGPDCDVTQPDCITWNAVEIGTGALCPIIAGEYGSADVAFGPATEHVSLVASTSGTYQIWVMVSTAVPGVPVDYTLIVDGGDPRDPFETHVFVGSPHCKYVWAGQEAAGMEPGSPLE